MFLFANEKRIYIFTALQLLERNGGIAVYEKVSTNMNFVEREKKVEKFWKDYQIFEKSIESRKNAPEYTF